MNTYNQHFFLKSSIEIKSSVVGNIYTKLTKILFDLTQGTYITIPKPFSSQKGHKNTKIPVNCDHCSILHVKGKSRDKSVGANAKQCINRSYSMRVTGVK